MLRTVSCCIAGTAALSAANAGINPIELTPTDVSSANAAYFTNRPTMNASTFLGFDPGSDLRIVDFNTAPDGPLSEGLSVTNQYASSGVTMNNIRITTSIYGGNNYGTGFATEDNIPQIFTFSTPVIAVGIVNTSPDNDLIQFWSGPNATGTLLLEFRDQQDVPRNFNIDRFVGGTATEGTRIGSFVVSNTSGDLELDELIFVIPAPGSAAPLMAIGLLAARRRR